MTAPRLLLCDDEPEICRFIRNVAESIGYEVHATTEAAEFTQLYPVVQPQVVMLDLVMPGTDGIELLRFLAEQHCPAQILLMSGFDSRIRHAAHLLGEAHSLKMAGIIAKPVRAAELRQRLGGLSGVRVAL